MAIARAKLVDVSLTRWYHCVTRCVRRAFLLGEGDHNREGLSHSVTASGIVVAIEQSPFDRLSAAWTCRNSSSIS
jgi:hypothetical protein